jgi:hypothetical protein
MSFLSSGGRAAALCLVGIMATPIGAAGALTSSLFGPTIGVTELFAAEQRSGIAMAGFDPVSYRLDTAPRLGRPDCDYVWRGIVWQFASEANRAAFKNDPETFAPRIGGYDAERIGNSIVVAADPALYVVQGNRLYLFRSPEHRLRFLADGALAAKAEASWLRVKTGLVQG